jgi:hypothetical protein
MLDRLGYARPDIPLDTPETDGDIAAAHAAGPHAVPAAVLTPAPQPPIALSQSLVEEISAPISPKGPSPGIAPPMRAGRYAQTVMVRPRVRATHAGILGLAVGACMFLAAAGWKVYEHVVARPSPATASVAQEPPPPVPSPPPSAPPPVLTQTAVIPSAAPAAPPSAPAMPPSSPTPVHPSRSTVSATPPAQSTPHVVRPPRPTPSAKATGSLRTDFDPNK